MAYDNLIILDLVLYNYNHIILNPFLDLFKSSVFNVL